MAQEQTPSQLIMILVNIDIACYGCRNCSATETVPRITLKYLPFPLNGELKYRPISTLTRQTRARAKRRKHRPHDFNVSATLQFRIAPDARPAAELTPSRRLSPPFCRDFTTANRAGHAPLGSSHVVRGLSTKRTCRKRHPRRTETEFPIGGFQLRTTKRGQFKSTTN